MGQLVDPPKSDGVPSRILCQPIDTPVSDIVTELPDEPIDSKPESNQPSSTNLDLPASTGSEPEASLTASETEGAAGDEGLPEWEPLTPELVEDEAIRGDFVLRWAVVGLALLLGISQISETRTLLHLKNGEYLLSHGLLPGSKDVFSYTATDRRWINLPWLFDIASASVFSLSGGIGLSIVQGLLAGLTFGLICHAVRPNIRTWWGSICAVLALLACYHQFTVQPELITLLGLSFCLWTLVQSEEPDQSHRVWLLVPAIWLWAQFDQRAWFGWFLLLLWAGGEWLSSSASSVREKSPLGKVALASFLVVVLHPFLWENWLAPLRMYVTDYPAMRFAYQGSSFIDQGFYPIWKLIDLAVSSASKSSLWTVLSHRTIAALVLFGITLFTLLLNRSRVLWSHLYAFIGFNALGFFATHELAAASLVNCALCTINAQSWYRERFGQVYSTDWLELLFSRGGRAVTVLSFFALAWLILSGRLDGPGGKRTGVGLDSHLASAMSDYQKLKPNLVDDQPFNFSMRQGDLMIWGGLKSFVDSRASLFFANGADNLLAVHNRTRQALRQKRDGAEGTGEPDVWKATFDKYQIRQASPRLNGPIPLPDYPTFRDLMSSNDFELNKLNAVTAVFLRKDRPDETMTGYLKDHSFDLVQQAFRTPPARMTDLTREWSKPATPYENLFSLRRPNVPGQIQEAQHYLELAITGNTLSLSQRAGAILLAIRHANEGLHEEPNSAAGYRVLGMSYSILGRMESSVLSQGGAAPVANPLRYFQSVAALQQALSLQPDDFGVILQLIDLYKSMGRLDVQLDLFQKLKRLRPASRSMTSEQRQERDSIIESIDRLRDPVAQTDEMIAKAMADGTDRTQVAMGAYQMGALLSAIKILEEDAIHLEKNPQIKLLLARWLNEAGRGREAAAILEGLEGLAGENGLPGWQDAAAMSALNVANYTQTIKLWRGQLKEATSNHVPPTLFTLPLLSPNPLLGPDPYPTAHVVATFQAIQGVRLEGSMLLYRIALAQMEAGSIEDAGQSIRQALQAHANSPLRPILRFYLASLTGEEIELTPAPAELEEVNDLSDPDPEPDQKPETESTESK